MDDPQLPRNPHHPAILRIEPCTRIKRCENDSRIRDADAPAAEAHCVNSVLQELCRRRELRQETNVGRNLHRTRTATEADLMDHLRCSCGKASPKQSTEFGVRNTLVRHPDAGIDQYEV